MGDLDRYERMAQRTRERKAAAPAELLKVAATRPGFAPDQIAGEGEQHLRPGDPHLGHRTHINFLAHGNGVICSCGAHIGCFSFIPPTEEEYAEMRAAQPDGCPVCRARGLSA